MSRRFGPSEAMACKASWPMKRPQGRAGVGIGLGLEPLPLMVVAAMASSMAFMLPVATPPNAIVFGSGRIRTAEMARAGLWLNFLSIFLVTFVVSIWAR